MKLRRRIEDVKKLNPQAMSFRDQQRKTVEAAIQDAIRDIYGSNSAEFHRHGRLTIWEGGVNLRDDEGTRQRKFAAGIPKTITIIEGLIGQLEEKKADLEINPEEIAISNSREEENERPRPTSSTNVYHVQHVNGIVSFGAGTTNVQKQYADVSQVLQKLMSAVHNATLAPEQKQKAQAKIMTIEAQLSDPEPDTTIIQRAYAGMEFLSTIGGCTDLMLRLASLISPFLVGSPPL